MPRRTLILAGFLLLLAGAIAWRLSIGADFESLDQSTQDALQAIRLSRVASAAIVGAALAVAGVMLQSLLRNPLASPDLLGLGSGAGLGVMLSILAAHHAGQFVLGLGFQTPAAVVGSLLAMSLIYFLSQRQGLLDPTTLILVGVAIAMLCAAGIELIRHLLPPTYSDAATRLLTGAINDGVSTRALWTIGLIVLGTIILGVLAGRAMDAAALGDDEAHSVGVALRPLRAMLFVSSGVLTACAIAIAGPIGFIGLVAPHTARLCIGPSHRVLIIAAAVLGATLVIAADALVRLLDLGTGRLPISILTSLLGAPMFIVLLRKRFVLPA
jgi:iron complex transport system permease protein